MQVNHMISDSGSASDSDATHHSLLPVSGDLLSAEGARLAHDRFHDPESARLGERYGEQRRALARAQANALPG